MSVHQKIATTERKIKAAFIYLVNEKPKLPILTAVRFINTLLTSLI